MSTNKKEINYIKSFCDSCKKFKLLEDFSGIKLCAKCEEKFYESLIKLEEDNEYGKDIVLNDKFKKSNEEY